MNPLADACPECFPGDAPAALPLSVKTCDCGELASYRCALCGHEWTCWWDAGSSGWPAARRAA
jgi:hypothetical protein